MFRKEVDYCSACFLLTPRDLFLQLGGFHSRYAPSYFEDSDYCLTLWEHGKKVIYEPTAAIVHFESASTETRKEVLELSRRNEAKFAEAHRPLLEARPIAGKFDWKLARFIVAGADRRRRILVVDDFPPVPLFGSGLARANTLVAALIAAGYEVTIAHGSKSHFQSQEIYAFIDRSIEVIPLEDATCAEVLRQRAPFYSDMLVSRPNNLKWVLRALDTSAEETTSASRRPRIIYDAEALYAERQRLFGELANGDASETSAPRWTHDVELGLARQVDIILSVSPREAAMMKQATGKPVFMVGFSVAPAPTPASWAERQTILFVGSLHEVDSPNYDSLRWFLREVGPLLPEDIVRAAKIVIAGYRAEGLPPLESGGLVVEWIGRQDDLTPVYDAARVFIAPTRYAAGIPYKCVEAASRGVPMVVTQVLAQQLEWQHGRDLLVADHRQPAQFAAAVAELYRSQQQWELVRENALARVAAELSPDVFQRQVEAVFSTGPMRIVDTLAVFVKDRAVREAFFVFAITRALVLAIFILGGSAALDSKDPGMHPVDARDRVVLHSAEFLKQLQRTVGGGDAGWYEGIAKVGYERQPFEATQQHTWAFFPLHPMLMRLGAVFTGEYLLTGALIANALFFTALVLLHKLVTALNYDAGTADRTVFYVAAGPVSYFFSVPMTESLYFCLTIGSFLAATHRRWWVAGILGGFSSAARVPGVLLLPALTLFHIERTQRPWWRREILWLGLIPVGPCPFLCFSGGLPEIHSRSVMRRLRGTGATRSSSFRFTITCAPRGL